MRSDLTPARHAGKTGVRQRVAFVERPIAWPDVLRAVLDDEARSFAVQRYRASGFDPDAFGHVRRAREAMADALTRTEDWLGGQSRVADTIREVRRRLERELWP